MKHTPMPWVRGSVRHKRGWRDELMVYDGNGVLIANCEAPMTDTRHYVRAMGEDEANARLIAASPLLLAALEKVQAASDHELECDFCWHADDCEIRRQMVADAGVAREGALRAARGAEADDEAGGQGDE